jgi:hypothetical protein
MNTSLNRIVESPDEDSEYVSKGRGEELVKHLFTSMNAITDWFKQYQVESIELWIRIMNKTSNY